MGRWHAHALRRAGVRVAAIVDTDSARAADLARRHAARTAPHLEEILGDIDVIHICTPAETHMTLAATALDAGKHLIVEKPIATTLSDTEHLLAQAERHRRLLCPVHQFIFQRGTQEVLTHRARLGQLRHVSFVICSAGAAGRGADPDAIAREILPHPFSVLARFAPRALSDAVWHVTRPAAGEIRAATESEGLSLSILISMEVRPTRNVIDLFGTSGSAHVDLFHGYALFHRGRVSRVHKVKQPFDLALRAMGAAAANLVRRAVQHEPAYPGLATLVSRYYSAVAGHAPMPIPHEETLAVARACDRITATLPLDSPGNGTATV